MIIGLGADSGFVFVGWVLCSLVFVSSLVVMSVCSVFTGLLTGVLTVNACWHWKWGVR